MFATDHFVFVHLQTCGDAFSKEFLLPLIPEARQLGSHLPKRLTPPALAHLPALGFVRNPWSYYALWYSLQSSRPHPGALFQILSENGTLDFESTLRNMLDLGATGARLNELLASLPEGFTGVGLNLPRFALEPIRGSELGFFSFLYRHMYDGPGIIHIRRVERLYDDLIATLVVLGQPVTARMRAFASEKSRLATAAAEDYAALYSPALRDLVAERDAELIARYGYRFGA
jgi:hypothetical protein